jgi:hypothetical protein
MVKTRFNCIFVIFRPPAKKSAVAVFLAGLGPQNIGNVIWQHPSGHSYLRQAVKT